MRPVVGTAPSPREEVGVRAEPLTTVDAQAEGSRGARAGATAGFT
jgi:hypothetical protein